MQNRIIPRRGKPLHLTLMILLLLLLLLVSACQAPLLQQANIRPAATQLGLTEESGTPVDVFLLLDQSDSMNGWDQSQGTDPQGLRMEASRYFLNNLAQRSQGPPYLRVGIINFGSDAPTDAMQPLSELTSSDTTTLPRLTARLTTSMMGYTNFQAALQRAEEGFQQANTFDLGRKGVVVLFTDGEPDDLRRLSLDGYFSEIRDFVQSRVLSKGCELFVIGIDSIGEAWSRSIPYWQQFLSEDRILRLSSMEDLRQRFNEVIRQTFFLPNTVPDQILGKELQFEVLPYLEEMQFDIYPEGSGNPQLAIFDPQGEQMQEGPGIELRQYDSYASITVKTPAPGQWMYKIIEGQGRVVVYNLNSRRIITCLVVSPRSAQKVALVFG